MHPRAYCEPVLRLLQQPELHRAVVLLGPRRVGKTILIRHLVAALLSKGISPKSIAYVEMDHPILHGLTLDALVRQIEEVTPVREELRYLFFDEIQSHKDWEKHLKPLVDHRSDLRLLVSGSAAAVLKRQSGESGAGRFTDFLLPPLTFSEFLSLSNSDVFIKEVGQGRYILTDIDRLNIQFIDYVNFGGYPELALSPVVRENPERFIKSDIVDKVLLRDLPQLYGISDIQELNSLFTLLAFNTSEEVSLNDLSKRSGVVKLTLQKYIEYLEAAFLIKRVYRVDQDGRRYKRNRSFKVYLTNTATYTGLFGVQHSDTPEFGHLVETALFSQWNQQQPRLNYARWGRSDLEVDLVESSLLLRPLNALEIKWSDHHVKNPQALKGLLKFTSMNQLPLALASTRSQIYTTTVGNVEVRQVPAAVLAYHFGVMAVRGQSADFEVQVQAYSSE